MTKITFIYIALNLVFFNLISTGGKIFTDIVSIISVLGILTIGIAHGAIDNILFNKNTSQANNTAFYLQYLTVIVGVVAFWLIAPNVACVFFILASAYHFGQSQFVQFSKINNGFAPILYLSWGSLILFLVFLLNSQELVFVIDNYFFGLGALRFLAQNAGTGVLVFGLLTIACLIYAIVGKKISVASFLGEIYILGLITLSFLVLPLLAGFALYFVVLHSLKVMREEYEFCQKSIGISSISSFIRLLLPLTIISILGLGFIAGIMLYFERVDWIPYVLLIALSCITIPHSVVMENFYRNDVLLTRLSG